MVYGKWCSSKWATYQLASRVIGHGHKLESVTPQS